MLFFHTYTSKYIEDEEDYLVKEVYKAMSSFTTHCNNGKGVVDKPLYVGIEFSSYDTISGYPVKNNYGKCYNKSKVQERTKIVGTKRDGLYDFNKVLDFMKKEGGVLSIQGDNYVLQDFPYMRRVKPISEGILAAIGIVNYRSLVDDPITLKEYFDSTELQSMIDKVLLCPFETYLMWDLSHDGFRLIEA